MTNVLLTCVGRRNYLAGYFRDALNGDGQVAGTDINPTAPGLVDCDSQYIVPGVYAENYVQTLLELCRDGNITLLFSLNDLELPALAKARQQFEDAGVTLAVSELPVINRCFDKLATFHWLRDNGIATPETYSDIDDALSALDTGDLQFPCMVKPRWGSGSIAIFTVYTRQELQAAYSLALSRTRRGMLATASAEDLEHSVLVQAMCTGTEYGCDILNDFSRRTRAAMTKEKLAMRGGETDKAILRNHPSLQEFCQLLGEKSGHVGNMDCDIFVDGDHFQVLEMNPRFGGGYPFSHVAGANFPSALLSWNEGDDVEPDESLLLYDVPFSKFDTLRRIGS